MVVFFLFYFFPILFTAIGIIILVGYFKTQKRNNTCTCQTTGKVIRIIKGRRRHGSNNSVTYMYYQTPCFQYFVNGCAYTVRGFSVKLHPLDSIATIYYNPSSPDIAHTGEKGPGLKLGISFILSAVLYIIFWSVMLRVIIYLP